MINRITDELLVATGRKPASATVKRTPPDEQGIGDQIKHWSAETEKFIASHPGASLAVALGVGIVLGWWVKRT